MDAGPCIKLELNDRHIRIAISHQSPVLQFAADELARYIVNLAECDVVAEGLECTPKDHCTAPSGSPDAYAIEGNGRTLCLVGNTERATLYAVYALLKASGCRWTVPGKDGEILTGLDLESLFHQRISDMPSLSVRCFAEDTDKKPLEKWVDEVRELVDWMPKAGCSTLFIMTHRGFTAQEVAVLLPEIERRGIDLEVGGHVLNEFLPRGLFEAQPELFRMCEGQRVPDGNFCVSNQRTIQIVAENTNKFMAAFPSATVYHLWATDSWGGRWCECDGCKEMSPGQQQIHALNGVADAIRDRYPDKMIDMLLYHDTIEINDGEKPRAQVYGFYAPRERCYAHGINEQSCAKNAWYKKMLEKASKHFGKDQIYIFEYYDDMILFYNMAVPLTRVISQDLKYYQSLGIHKVQSLMFGRYSWWAYPLNMYVFAELTWDMEKDVRDIVTDYCNIMFGTASEIMLTYYVTLEAAMSRILTFCGYAPKVFGDLARPPSGQDFSERHLQNVQSGISALSDCQKCIEDAANTAVTPIVQERIDKELLIFKTTRIVANAIECLMQLSQKHTVSGDAVGDVVRSVESLDQLIEGVPEDVKGSAGENIFLRITRKYLIAAIVERLGSG